MIPLLFQIVACTQSPPPPVHLSGRFAEELCSAPHVVIGRIVAVQSFEDERVDRERPDIWSDVRFHVEESLRRKGRDELHLVMMGPERELRHVHPGPGGALQPAVGLRYVLAYTEHTVGGPFLDPGDPGVSAWRSILGSPADQEALVAAVHRTVEACPALR